MAHIVLCPFCKQKFDRDKEKYIKIGKNRYSHAKCGINNAQENNLTIPEVVDPTIITTCIYCKKSLNKTDKDIISISKTKFAHKICAEKESQRELSDEEKLNNYIMKLFNTNYVSPKIQKQIKNYMAEYNFSYTGILKALIYFFEIKGNDIDKANDGIGIVPYIYKDAYNYYYSLWIAKQKNIDKDISNFIPKVKQITIKRPVRKERKRKLFTFLDEECESNSQ